MKIKIQNTYNKELKEYDRSSFELKEHDKVISGRFQMSKKDKESDKWLNSPSMGFVCFKNKAEQETIKTILNHGGKSFDVTGELMFEVGPDGKSYFKFNILKAWLSDKVSEHSKAKGNGFVKQEEEGLDEVPF